MKFSPYKLLSVVLIAIHLSGFAQQLQQNQWPPQLIQQRNQLIQYIRNDNISAIADMVPYPISRGFPPVIYTKLQFIAIYKSYFDSLSVKYNKYPIPAKDTMLDYLNGDVLVLDFWLYPGGVVKRFYHELPGWQEKRKRWQEHDRSNLYTDLRNFSENKLLCETDSFLARIDQMDSNFRLSLWPKGALMNQKPLMLLYSKPGNWPYSGSAGITDYIFRDGILKYSFYPGNKSLDDFWLNMYRNGKLIKKLRCKLLK